MAGGEAKCEEGRGRRDEGRRKWAFKKIEKRMMGEEKQREES